LQFGDEKAKSGKSRLCKTINTLKNLNAKLLFAEPRTVRREYDDFSDLPRLLLAQVTL